MQYKVYVTCDWATEPKLWDEILRWCETNVSSIRGQKWNCWSDPKNKTYFTFTRKKDAVWFALLWAGDKNAV